MRPEPSKYYHPEPDACPYHLIIGLDRRPFNTMSYNIKRKPSKHIGVNESMLSMSEKHHISLRMVALIIREAGVKARARNYYNIAEMEAAIARYYPGPNVYPVTEASTLVGASIKTIKMMVDLGYVKPATTLAGVDLFEIEAINIGLAARREDVKRAIEHDKAARAHRAALNKKGATKC